VSASTCDLHGCWLYAVTTTMMRLLAACVVCAHIAAATAAAAGKRHVIFALIDGAPRETASRETPPCVSQLSACP
jgi:hypothetical protein